MPHMTLLLQGSIAIFYNWLKIAGDPHSWVTDMIKAYALPVNFVGLSTEDRRFIYPQKEVGNLFQKACAWSARCE